VNQPKNFNQLILKVFTYSRSWRIFLALGLGVLIFFQITAFSPSRLEQDPPAKTVDPTELVPEEKADIQVKPDLPKDRVPEYSIDGFQYVATEKNKKQWKINSVQAFFYQPEGFVHNIDVKSELYDSDDNITYITSKEAKYVEGTKDLELFGNVIATFPDGLVVKAPYALYRTATKKISVPRKYPILGYTTSEEKKNEHLEFTSMGMDYDQDKQLVSLPEKVSTKVIEIKPGEAEPEITTVLSDQALLNREDNTAIYTMVDRPNFPMTFVKITQPGMHAKGRRAEFDFKSEERKIERMKMFEKVEIFEDPKKPKPGDIKTRKKPPQARYSTSDYAEFLTAENLIILKEYPQVYQDGDTITGEVVVMHRDTDLVEVEQGNAYSEGRKDNGT